MEHEPNSDGVDDAPDADVPAPARRQRGTAKQWVLVLLVAAVLGTGGYAWAQVRKATSSPFTNVSYTIPKAPLLVAQAGETVYRIDATQSKATYGVDEKVIGSTAGHATGSTQGIAGDIAINPTHPSASRVAPIVINIEQFHSDNSLRDARVRQDFLQSHTYPLARFTTKAVKDLPASLQDGQWYTFRLVGTLRVHNVDAPVTWYVRGEFAKGKLTATATTKIKLSTFKAGPISIAGLVKTSDDVDLSLTLSALDPSKFTIPQVIPAPTQGKKKAGGPSFAKDIEPVLAANCASCHNVGQVGAPHWTLQTAGDAAAIADGIRVTTKAKYMPPWPASDKGVPLAHNASLDAKTIALLGDWAAHGGQLDVPESTPIRPPKAVAALRPRKDLVLRMATPYTGLDTNTNDYRCFVLDPHFTKPTFVTGYAFQADQVEEIHHGQLFQISAAQKASAPQVDGKDGRPGWECYGGPGLRGPGPANSGLTGGVGQGNLIGGWAPGQTPVRYPMSAGILFQPGEAIVLQVHYHYENKPTPDRTSVALQTEAGTNKAIKQMVIQNPVGPVEIPCDPGVKAKLCDRTAALQDAVKRYGSNVETGLLFVCHQSKEKLAALYKDGVAQSTCDWPITGDGTITGVTGHMHTLGKSITMTVNKGKPDQHVLLDVPQWNFDWQMNYQLQTPLKVKKGDTVTIDCSWDRSLDPNRAPRYILFAEGTEDEMCFGTYSFVPDNQTAHAPQYRFGGRHHRRGPDGKPLDPTATTTTEPK